jgi:hypothetical protein
VLGELATGPPAPNKRFKQSYTGFTSGSGSGSNYRNNSWKSGGSGGGRYNKYPKKGNNFPAKTIPDADGNLHVVLVQFIVHSYVALLEDGDICFVYFLFVFVCFSRLCVLVIVQHMYIHVDRFWCYSCQCIHVHVASTFICWFPYHRNLQSASLTSASESVSVSISAISSKHRKHQANETKIQIQMSMHAHTQKSTIGMDSDNFTIL